MKDTKKLTELVAAGVVAGALVGAATGFVLYLLKKQELKKRLEVVSDAGYETAYDIHYPLKYKG